ncbi:MAG: DNA/RNA non-specific endonuclease [Bacteroidales bacterium]|nr:DNA/RNA non-specific endonuclease [Bacteroidales bacterium]
MCRKLILYTFLLFCIAGLSSCKENPVNLRITLDEVIVSGEETTQFLTIETDPNQVWTVTVNPGNDWCFVYPPSGAGNAFPIVSTVENGDGAERTATITVRAGKTSKSVDLTQQAAALIDVIGSTNTSNSASTLTFQIRTKSMWTASITEGSSFCSVTPTSGDGNGAIVVSFQANPAGTPRTANLLVTGSGEEINLILTQGSSGSRPEQYIPWRLELPEVKNTRWYVEHKYYESKVGDTIVVYAMEYDTAQRHSVWIAYVFDAFRNQKNVNRSNAWAFDPIIPREFQSLNSSSQTFPGYDRGHLCASEDRVFSLIANQMTFYFSNMSPQVGWFNQQIWANLESYVRTWAKMCDTLYVVTGGAINPGVETLGVLESRNNVTIAKWWFKALVQRTGNSFTGIAWWMENKPQQSASRPDGYTSRAVTFEYAITIRELEQRTGINFFPRLNDIRPGLEDQVETQIDYSKWPL